MKRGESSGYLRKTHRYTTDNVKKVRNTKHDGRKWYGSIGVFVHEIIYNIELIIF